MSRTERFRVFLHRISSSHIVEDVKWINNDMFSRKKKYKNEVTLSSSRHWSCKADGAELVYANGVIRSVERFDSLSLPWFDFSGP